MSHYISSASKCAGCNRWTVGGKCNTQGCSGSAGVTASVAPVSLSSGKPALSPTTSQRIVSSPPLSPTRRSVVPSLAIGESRARHTRGKTPRGKTPRSKGKTPRGKTPRGKTPRGKTPRGASLRSVHSPRSTVAAISVPTAVSREAKGRTPRGKTPRRRVVSIVETPIEAQPGVPRPSNVGYASTGTGKCAVCKSWKVGGKCKCAPAGASPSSSAAAALPASTRSSVSSGGYTRSRSAQVCSVCDKSLSGPKKVVSGKSFHLMCFKCVWCAKMFLFDTDAKIVDGNLLCKPCVKRGKPPADVDAAPDPASGGGSSSKAAASSAKIVNHCPLCKGAVSSTDLKLDGQPYCKPCLVKEKCTKCKQPYRDGDEIMPLDMGKGEIPVCPRCHSKLSMALAFSSRR